MKNKIIILTKTTLLALPIVILSGCDWFSSPKQPKIEKTTKTTTVKKDGSTVLVSINGEPVITEDEFKKNLEQMIQSNPYFKGADINSLPKELLRKFLDQLVTQALIEKYQVKNDIENDAEFQKSYEETEKLLKRSLMVQLYEKKIYDGISVTKDDIQKHFDDNKDRFVKNPGGVLTVGASFSDEKEAEEFLEDVKNKLDDFEKLAEENKNATFKDFGRVNKSQANQGFQFDATPGPIKDSALAMRKDAGVEKVKVGKEFWVIKAWDKKDSEYFKLDEIESHVESMIKNNKFRDILDVNLKKLRENDFTVTLNEEYFKPSEPAAEAADDIDEDEEKKTEKPTSASAA